jgi:hypothetical protein
MVALLENGVNGVGKKPWWKSVGGRLTRGIGKNKRGLFPDWIISLSIKGGLPLSSATPILISQVYLVSNVRQVLEWSY